MNSKKKWDRRGFVKASSAVLASASLATYMPFGNATTDALQLDFFTIKDPDGWHPSLRLKGDWLIFRISDGRFTGYGEASHSKQDQRCQEIAGVLFNKYFRDFDLNLDNLASIESALAETNPDFVTATALSGINQALYELLAKREQVPVWRLFREKATIEKVALYTTINRSLKERSVEEYLELVGELGRKGFKQFKCAPFEKVNSPVNAVANAQEGLRTLEAVRKHFPDMGIRVDFHERFVSDDFFELLAELEPLSLDWLEEPFPMGGDYRKLRQLTNTTLAGGEIFWGMKKFREIIDEKWVDVIMPDVKHIGGFGPLLSAIKEGRGQVQVSPHNPSGPVSTAASLHAAAIFPGTVKSLEFAFDRGDTRASTGERVENGFIYLNDSPGWGLDGLFDSVN